MIDNISRIKIIFGVLIAVVVVFSFITVLNTGIGSENKSNTEEFEFEKFQSESEYKNYVSQDDPTNSIYNLRPRVTPVTQPTVDITQESAGDTSTRAGSGSSFKSFDTRQTNTQESGIGEADIVKVLNNRTYYSRNAGERIFVPEPRIGEDIKIPRNTESKLYGIKNPNRDEFSISNKIDDLDGKMLRSEQNLILYNDSRITGFNIEDDDSLSRDWNKSLNSSNRIETTRRIGSKAYFVVRESADSNCVTYQPVESYSIECTDIYKPDTKTQTDTIFTVFSLDMKSGDIEDEMSFVGSGGETSVYMSSKSVYVSYKISNYNDIDVIELILEKEELNYNSGTENRLEELKEYNISNDAKMTELRKITRNDNNFSMTDIRETIEQYVSDNKRNLFRTSIVKINVNDGELEKSASGSVPGEPLNQFSFDEKDGELRVATTVKPNDRDISANDVYILDSEMDIKGSEKGMAKGQRIYAVRFIGDKGYAITYRQVDPLHVLDLSDSSNPKEVGKLKLPGFSEYLHKVDDGMILGIGESQNRRGKIVLFNVSEPSNPKIADDLILNNTYSTAVSESHHAFIKDDEKSNAYIPAQNKVFVVDYSNNKLNLESKIDTGSSTKRTRLYEENIVVFSERDITNINRKTYDKIENINLDS